MVGGLGAGLVELVELGVRRSLRAWTDAARALRLSTMRQTVKPTVTSTASQNTPSRMASQSGRMTSGCGGVAAGSYRVGRR